MRKIGILGGTFNPIHNGHLIIAETARQHCMLDEVLLIPSGCSYMKNQTEILPGSLRLEIVQLAAEENPFFKASDMEVLRQGNSYTYETILTLKEQNPEDQLYYIVGADTLFYMENWRKPEIIFQNAVTLAAVRDGFLDDSLKEKTRCLSEKYGADIRFLPSLHVEISSTDIRNRCRSGQSCRYLLPESVRLFIEKNGLYR